MPLINPSFVPSDTANFYLAVFSQNMQSMIYGSCFGGGDSREHVDGGTSRFDKNGKIYQEFVLDVKEIMTFQLLQMFILL